MSSSVFNRLVTFFRELQRRRVYQVTAIYVVLAVGGLELASILLPSTRLPGWSDELFLGLAIVGLPLVLVLAWTFDVTESGIERTPDSVSDADTVEAGSPVEAGRSRDAGLPGDPTRSDDGPRLDPLAVAVLPFENLSRADTAEPFVVGLHDDLLTELSRASALTVISRTSVRAYVDTDKSVRQIARELRAGTIVEGGVQQTGTRVRLNVQLIDARTDGHLWAERYDRELTADNIFELQSELAARIMAELHARLTAEEEALIQSQPTGDLDAYRLLATGRQAFIDRSESGFRAAADLFERALDRDPGYALAWAGLGEALVGLVAYGHSDSAEVLERGGEACRKALELDPDLAEAHSAWGRYRSHVRDAPGAIAAHARAIELRPSFAGAHQWSCWCNLLLRNGEAALPFGKKATRLDPLDPEATGNLAMAYLATGDPERALSEAGRILLHHPSFQYGHWVKGLSLLALDRSQEGRKAFAALGDRWTRGWSEVAEALVGGREVRLAVSKRLGEEGIPFKAGVVRALLGEVDEAVSLMRRNWPLPWDEALYLYVHRGAPLDELQREPAFERLVDDVVGSWRTEVR